MNNKSVIFKIVKINTQNNNKKNYKYKIIIHHTFISIIILPFFLIYFYFDLFL